MLRPGRHCGKAVAIRWRATGGAGHKCHNERADWPFVADREVGRLGRCSGRHILWLEAVAAASGISGEVSLAVAADDLSGACALLHTPIFLEVF